MSPAKVAFLQLASCWGCHQSLLDTHLTLLHVLPELEIVYWPAVVDFKLQSMRDRPDQSVVVGFIEGQARTQADIDNVKLWRKKCQIIVAIGSCAVLGGIAGMGNLYSKDDLIARKFLDRDFIDESAQLPTQHVPPFLDVIPDLHNVIQVDANLPGCPPKGGNIAGLIASVLGAVSTPVDATRSMCDVCPLGTCLLDAGTLCFGPITAVGDPIGAIAAGYPVVGEFGLTKQAHAANAEKLYRKITEKPLTRPEVEKTVEALMMTLGSTPLGYLLGKSDVILRTKLDPDALKMKLKGDKEIVDFTQEGYPAIVNDIIGALMADLKNNALYDTTAQTVCTSCDRNVEDKEVYRFKRDYVGLPDQEKCLLVQGYVCMGPLTAPGCGATCPRANSPCLGCYGPAVNVDDYVSKAISYFPSICKDTPENIKRFFSDPAGLFGRFCIPTSSFGHKMAPPKED